MSADNVQYVGKETELSTSEFKTNSHSEIPTYNSRLILHT